MHISLILTGLSGLLAALLVGVGEYLLHYDALARFSAGGYEYMRGIPAERSTAGHFFGVFGATLYPIGCFHIYQMLRPASNNWAFLAFLLGAFGFMVGVVWIGSRASISALLQLPDSAEVTHLIALYDLRYETLLQVVRVTTLLLSMIFIVLTLTGRSFYPRWMAVFNPIAMLIASFLLFISAPEYGKHVMPIALNVAFFIFFALSLCFAITANPIAARSAGIYRL